MLLHSSSTVFQSGPGRPPCCCFLCDCGASETPGGNTNSEDSSPAEKHTTMSSTATAQIHEQIHLTTTHYRTVFWLKVRRVRPASVGPRWWFRTAARCWTRTEWSVRRAAEGETAPESTSSTRPLDLGDTPWVSQVNTEQWMSCFHLDS